MRQTKTRRDLSVRAGEPARDAVAGGAHSLRIGWGVPASGAELPVGEVHVALTLVERPVETLAELTELLTDEERAQVRRFRFEADRRRFTVCRGMLRLWLAHYIGVPAQGIRFVYGANGKPAVSGHGSEFRFNLSHSGGLAAFAVTRLGEVGIDLEEIHELPGWEQISVLCFSPEERARLSGQPERGRQRQFFRLWTRHEAWLKAWGVGLGGTQPAGRDESWAQPGAPGWVETFEPAPGYVASVAVLPAVGAT